MKFCHPSDLRLWRTGMLLLTKTKGYISNIHYTQDSQNTFKPNLTCIFLSLRANWNRNVCHWTPCKLQFLNHWPGKSNENRILPSTLDWHLWAWAFLAWVIFSPIKLLALINFQSWDIFGHKKFSVLRHFQPWDISGYCFVLRWTKLNEVPWILYK